MLRIYYVLLELVRLVMPRVTLLEQREPDLARQCRRALTSAPLNMAEGSYSQGKLRRARFHNSMASLREVLACFETAAAMGYMDEITAEERRLFDHVLGTLVRLLGY